MRRGIALGLLLLAGGVARAQAPVAHARVFHEPPSSITAGQALTLVASIEDAWHEPTLEVRYRPSGSQVYAAVPLERSSAGGYRAEIPASAFAGGAAEYYIVGVDRAGGEHDHFASASAPHRVAATPSDRDEELELERRLVGGRLSAMHFSAEIDNFGNASGGRPDYLYKVEGSYTYRFLRRLYAVTMGYGHVRSQGPIRTGGPDSAPTFLDGAAKHVGLDYGFAEMRLRLQRKVDLDGRLIVGASDQRVVVGAGGRLRLGPEHGSHVAMGLEYVPTVGTTGTLRLAWDTVPPLLMAATLVATNWPRSDRGGGAGIRVSAELPVGQRLRVGLELGYIGRTDAVGSVTVGTALSYEY